MSTNDMLFQLAHNNTETATVKIGSKRYNEMLDDGFIVWDSDSRHAILVRDSAPNDL